MTKKKPEDYYTEVDSDKAYETRWKTSPKSLTEQDAQWDRTDRLEAQRAARAAQRRSVHAATA
ncbi:hypothetical protein CH298_13330 [Rhodococcoides fascians]|uniref:hypothetical protein n=1 Tax=Rhodococcoides fascians TaxID=1828 RepID=UPI000B9C6F6F|nr:hypothetical protein [Rhodococcus fascians]OZE89961.1 hypothetical protein CH303_13210 [Rhodococcus fascians]OZF18268.1 hypothetical protein CH298_13330 [Rhodococcus fascians]OZF21719.1 hypothetical protein CH297_13225 [Rhodococcus fascians]OZF67344.1 hypothetical protein CH308_13125 [Rhodococcus fascians]OZF70534.1 hypothetical protein CH307_13325 [Rhodococcus fascians]